MCQNHSDTSCAKKPFNSTNYALEQALLADDTVAWEIQRLLIVEAIEAGAVVDHPVEHFHGNLVTALYVAVIHQDAELIRHLLQKGAHPNLDIYDSFSIFSYVDSVAVAQAFVACGVQPTEKAGGMFGGLLHGLMQPVPEALELLRFYLERDANPNLPDWSGDTPLHVLARMSSRYYENLDLLRKNIEALVKAGADKEIKNLAGKTAVDLVKEKGSGEVAEVFMSGLSGL